MKKLICFVLILFAASCKKQEVRISAINPVTGVGIPDLRYEILEEKTGWNGEKYKKIAEGVLNEHGLAMEDLQLKTNRSYLLTLEKPANTCYFEPDYQYTFAKGDKNFDFVYEIVPCAHLKHKFNNVNCINEFDTLRVKILNLKNNYYSSNFQNFTGCQNFDSGDFSSVPYGEVRYYWEVVKNGITNTFYDTIYLEEGEYRTYEINY